MRWQTAPEVLIANEHDFMGNRIHGTSSVWFNSACSGRIPSIIPHLPRLGHGVKSP